VSSASTPREGSSAAEARAAEPARDAPPSEITSPPREEDVGRPSRRHRVGHALVHLVLPVAFAAGVGLLGSTLGLTVAGRQTVSLGPFQVQFAGGVGKGVTDIALPPLGRITADTHLAPLRFRATLQDIQIQRLTTELREKGIDTIVDEVESDTHRRIVPFALRLLAVGVLGGLVAGAVVYRHHWKLAVITVATSLLATAGSEIIAWQTYDPSALLSPTFHGSIALAPKFIGPGQTALDQIDKVRAGLSRVIDGAIGVFLSVQGTPLDTEDEIRVLHISDIHLSPLGMAFAQQLAEAFRVNFVIDTGDITSFGTPAENLILSQVPNFHRPYVFVRGNHDSAGLQAAM
jgi:hypothetical protein